MTVSRVTILILVDGFLQSRNGLTGVFNDCGHNPYFSRWFSAIDTDVLPYSIGNNVTILILVDGFLQYELLANVDYSEFKVTILILVDGFLQLCKKLLGLLS